MWQYFVQFQPVQQWTWPWSRGRKMKGHTCGQETPYHPPLYSHLWMCSLSSKYSDLSKSYLNSSLCIFYSTMLCHSTWQDQVRMSGPFENSSASSCWLSCSCSCTAWSGCCSCGPLSLPAPPGALPLMLAACWGLDGWPGPFTLALAPLALPLHHPMQSLSDYRPYLHWTSD